MLVEMCTLIKQATPGTLDVTQAAPRLPMNLVSNKYFCYLLFRDKLL